MQMLEGIGPNGFPIPQRWWLMPTAPISRRRSKPMRTMKSKNFLAQAIAAKGVAEAKGIRQMNRAPHRFRGRSPGRTENCRGHPGQTDHALACFRRGDEPQNNRCHQTHRCDGTEGPIAGAVGKAKRLRISIGGTETLSLGLLSFFAEKCLPPPCGRPPKRGRN
jgi:hypothetical protein